MTHAGRARLLTFAQSIRRTWCLRKPATHTHVCVIVCRGINSNTITSVCVLYTNCDNLTESSIWWSKCLEELTISHWKNVQKCTWVYCSYNSVSIIDNDWDKNVLCEQDINFDIHDMKIFHIIRLASYSAWYATYSLNDPLAKLSSVHFCSCVQLRV